MAEKSTSKRTDRETIEESNRERITTGQSQMNGAINIAGTDFETPLHQKISAAKR